MVQDLTVSKCLNYKSSPATSWIVFFDFSLTVKAAPHECVNKTGLHCTIDIGKS